MSRPSGRIVVLATYETLCRGLDHGHKHLFKTPGSAYLCLHVEKDTSVFLRFFEVHIIIIVYIILIWMLYSVMHRFDKIINKEIPSTVVYEDDKVLSYVWL